MSAEHRPHTGVTIEIRLTSSFLTLQIRAANTLHKRWEPHARARSITQDQCCEKRRTWPLPDVLSRGALSITNSALGFFFLQVAGQRLLLASVIEAGHAYVRYYSSYYCEAIPNQLFD